MKKFFCEINKKEISYLSLIRDLNKRKEYKYVSNHNDFYLIFRDIVASLLNDSKIVLIDSDLSQNEVEKLNIFSDELQRIYKCEYPDIQDIDDLLTRLTIPRNKWRVDLFTSGTTGVPKKITHTFDSITRAVKISPDKKADVWGFAYNPTHIAGVQVFFQALLNLNTIVNLFNLKKDDIIKSIDYYKITNISATPTFYRLLYDGSKKFENVKRVTSGGEKLDSKLFNLLQSMFPNAKILNVYASTEIGTLFASYGEYFVLKESLRDKIKIIDNELYVSSEYINNDDNDLAQDNWYKTGDYVEVISDNPLTIKIIGRINEIVNIGGYKVHLSEVEEAINSLPFVVNCSVYSKRNSVLGNIIMCDVVLKEKSISEQDIHKFLSSKLQPFKIPRIINIVEEIKTTRTGKVQRI